MLLRRAAPRFARPLAARAALAPAPSTRTRFARVFSPVASHFPVPSGGSARLFSSSSLSSDAASLSAAAAAAVNAAGAVADDDLIDSDLEAEHSGALPVHTVTDIDADLAPSLPARWLPRSQLQWRSLTHAYTSPDDSVVLRLAGRDAAKVLNTLTTQHIPDFLRTAALAGFPRVPTALAPYISPTASKGGDEDAVVSAVPVAACYASWLSPKGRYLFDTVIELESLPDSLRSAPSPASAAATATPGVPPVKRSVQEDAASLQNASFLLHVPTARASALKAHIKANALRCKASLTAAEGLKAWTVAVRASEAAEAEEAVWGGVQVGAEGAAEDAAAAHADAAATATADSEAIGANSSTEVTSGPVYRVFIDPRTATSDDAEEALADAADAAADAAEANGDGEPNGSLLSYAYIPSPTAPGVAPPAASPSVAGAAGWGSAGSGLSGIRFVRITGPADMPPPLPPPFVDVHPVVMQVAETVLGIPKSGSSLIPDKTLPLEANLDHLNGVHFHKGCYLGQELVSRTHFRGLVRKRLLPAVLTPPSVAGAPTPWPADADDLPVAREAAHGHSASAHSHWGEDEDGSIEHDPSSPALRSPPLFPWKFLRTPPSAAAAALARAGTGEGTGDDAAGHEQALPPASPAELAAKLGIPPGSPLWDKFTSGFDAAPRLNTMEGYTPAKAACGKAAAAAAAATVDEDSNTPAMPPVGATLLRVSGTHQDAGGNVGSKKAEVGTLLAVPAVTDGSEEATAIANVGLVMLRLSAVEPEASTTDADAASSGADQDPVIIAVAPTLASDDAGAAAGGDDVSTDAASGADVSEAGAEWGVVPLCPAWLRPHLFPTPK